MPRPQPRFVCDPVTNLRQADVVPLHCSLLELEPGQCKWPTSEEDGRHLFCGCPTIDDNAYCWPHHELSINHRPLTGGWTRPDARARAIKRFGVRA